MYGNVCVPDTQSQLHLSLAELSQNDLTACIPPAMVANIPSSLDLSSIIDRWEQLGKENEELNIPPNYYKGCLQNV